MNARLRYGAEGRLAPLQLGEKSRGCIQLHPPLVKCRGPAKQPCPFSLSWLSPMSSEKLDASSVLLVTLDSCRFDSFSAARAPNMKSVGDLHLALAPANFTLASHAAMFVGFTPGVPSLREPFVNPKWGRLFRLAGPAFMGKAEPLFTLDGRSIVEGFKNKGYFAVGSGAVGWFDPTTPAGVLLTRDFDEFHYSSSGYRADLQVEWLLSRLREHPGRSVFMFLNVGETHTPYFYKDAPWQPANYCVPFGSHNDATECRKRQVACVEYVDDVLGELIDRFSNATTVICGDHGDCWGEDGLWEHGITHPKVLEVPLIIRVGQISAETAQ